MTVKLQIQPDTLYFPWKVSMAQAKYLQLTGNSVTGKEAAEMGWLAKSFPAETLEDEVMREGGLKTALEWRDGAFKREGFG